MASQTIPWAAMMNQQAQAIAPRSEADGSSPAEQMMSQVPPDSLDSLDTEDQEQAQALLSAGVNPNIPLSMIPQQTKDAVTRSMKIKMKGPMSQTAVDQNTLAQDRIQQYDALSKEALNTQQAGIEQLQDQINQAGKVRQGLDYTPFAGMARFLDPSNDFTKEAMATRPQTNVERADKMIALQQALQQRKEAMSKDQLAALGEQIKAAKQSNPLELESKLSTIRRNNAMADAFSPGGMKANMQEQSIAEREHSKILGELNHNKGLVMKMNAIQGIDNAGKIIEDAPTVTPQIFHDYQQALVGAITRGNSGIGERAERYMKSAGIDAATVRQYLSGDPVSIPSGKENLLYQATQEFAKSERGNIEKQYGDIMKSVSTGQGHIYDKHPLLKKDLDDKIQSMRSMIAPSVPGGPSVGEEHDGYVFKGGDPADKNNWEKK